MAKQPKLSFKKITQADIRMYRMGTGDCFIVKFLSGEGKKKENVFTMMIDCGTWQGEKKRLADFIRNLKEYVAEDRKDKVPTIDLLVVTHEHKDHVYGFDACSDLFVNTVTNPRNFIVKNIWMGWTENDNPVLPNDELGKKVKQWKEEYGQRKKALNATAQALKERFGTDEQKKERDKNQNGLVAFQYNFSEAVNQFADLHFSARAGQYTGGLKGMNVVKQEIAQNNITYLHPGQIIENMLDGVRFYVLGPPISIDAIKKESGKDGETFSHSHNNSLTDNDSFATAMLNLIEPMSSASILPFDDEFIVEGKDKPDAYTDTRNAWRTIDHEWLNSAGSLALRMNSATNNLSLALAIEFIDSKRVMLFPGDAEFGSWESWHTIWPTQDGKKPLVEDLLNRTIFYKVAHHLSHNGTAKKQGVEMMTHPDLVAMATLDYTIISDGWKSTMPNRYLIDDLLTRTKGRLIVMNEDSVTIDKVPIVKKINESRQRLMNTLENEEFRQALKPNELFLQFSVKA